MRVYNFNTLISVSDSGLLQILNDLVTNTFNISKIIRRKPIEDRLNVCNYLLSFRKCMRNPCCIWKEYRFCFVVWLDFSRIWCLYDYFTNYVAGKEKWPTFENCICISQGTTLHIHNGCCTKFYLFGYFVLVWVT